MVAIVWSLVATIRMVVRTWWRRVSLGGSAVTYMDQVIRSCEKITCLLHYSNNEEYEVGNIYNSVVYTKESEMGHLLGFYYLVY